MPISNPLNYLADDVFVKGELLQKFSKEMIENNSVLKVDKLIMQVAEENGLEMMDQLAELNPATGSLAPPTATASKASSQEDELGRR